MRQLAKIVMAFKDDGGFQWNSTRLEIIGTIAEALANGEDPGFVDEERNYANIEGLETALQAAGVAYAVDHNEGGGYSGCSWVWTPEGGKADAFTLAGGGDLVILVDTLKSALTQKNALELIQGLVDNAEAASGRGMPPFEIKDSQVERYLAKIQAARALVVAP